MTRSLLPTLLPLTFSCTGVRALMIKGKRKKVIKGEEKKGFRGNLPFARTLLPLLLFLFTPFLHAQITPRVLPPRVEDALRFNLTAPMGNARFAGTGGSMTAIGVVGTTLHTNPAGIGWNRYSAFEVTPGFTFNNLDARLVNGTGNENNQETKTAFVVPSLSLVWAGDTRSINWSTFNFGFSYTRMADFNETIAFNGRSEGSIIDAVVEDLNDGVGDPFRTDLAQNIPGAIQQDDLGFFSDFDLESSVGGQVRRSGRVERTGGLNELALGFGGNYKEKVLWGLTLGIPNVNFKETKIYDEVDDRDEITFFDNAGFDENLELSGSGVNFKFGLIARPTEQLRLSAAVHSPTFWTIDEVYETTFEYNYTDNGQALGGTELSPRSEAAFNLQTPWRFYFGGGYLIGRSGFVSIDADYSNLAGTSFATDDFANIDDAANADVDATLGSSLGLRLGGELNLKPFQVRAGVGYRQNPVIDLRNNEDGSQINLSGGLGYAKDKFFIDLAVRAETKGSYYAPYRTFAFDGQVVETDRTRLTGLVTVGFRGF